MVCESRLCDFLNSVPLIPHLTVLHIEPFQDADWPEVHAILRAAFATGDTFVFAPDTPEADLRRAWTEAPASAFTARGEDGKIAGVSYLKANQPGLGSHVANAGYVVAEHARGRGVATALCEHSQKEAAARGFRGMQFNLVVSTNDVAVRLWQKLGFRIIGTAPGAFRHATMGYVDTLIMFKPLTAPDA